MRRDARKYLCDVRQAARLLNEFTRGKVLADYEADAMLRSAVERQFEIIGEALSNLAKADGALAAAITGYQRIIAFRNVLIHGYADVDDRLVWNVLESSLPILVHEVDALLGEECDGGQPADGRKDGR